MKNLSEAIPVRRSVRTFDGRVPDAQTLDMLLDAMREAANPYGIPVEFRILDAKAEGLSCPVVTGVSKYLAGKLAAGPDAMAAVGYSFELAVLHAQAMGLGTCWLGGTMNRGAFEQAMSLAEGECMPCASPIGYAAEKMSLRETMMRRAIGADERLPFAALFFDGSRDTPLTPERAGRLAGPLELVRLAPSAVNKQPWRAVVCGDAVHFYLQRSAGFGKGGRLDMQMIDMGIALCHFAVAAAARGMVTAFVREDPGVPMDGEYIASYRIQ